MNVSITKYFGQQSSLRDGSNDQERAKIFRLRWPKAINQFEVDARWLEETMREAVEFEAWKLVGFDTLEEFCEKKLGKSLDEVERVCEGVRQLQARGVTGRISAAEAIAAAPMMAGQGARTDIKHRDNVTKLKRGNQASYLAARLKRDHPAIAARVQAGEFKSIRAAAIQAGIIKVKTRYEKFCLDWDKLSRAEQARFRNEKANRVEP